MRNLKRALSLVLASVMVLGLMIVGSSAKTSQFADADQVSEEYTEAIDVLTTMNVIEGKEDGTNFDPKGTLTREEAAKVLSVMLLGEENADRLGNNTQIFKDVAAGRWSAGYIAYCANTDPVIIAGDGTGNFDPDGKLTGVAFGKMLLTALGYDAEIEGYVNTPSWAINVASDMVEAKIDVKGITLSDPITREQAAQMALNTIKAPMVEYEGRTQVTVNGAEIVVGGNQAKYVTTTLANGKNIDDRTLTNTGNNDQGGYTVEFGERYMTYLKVDDDVTDEFGRPAHTWSWKNDKIDRYLDDLLVDEYTAKVTGEMIYNLLGETTIRDNDLVSYIDGKPANLAKTDLVKQNKNAILGTANGVHTQVFVDNDDELTYIVTINTYLAKAEEDYDEKNNDVDLTVFHIEDKGEDDVHDYVKTSGVDESISVDGDEIDVTGVKKDDLFLVTVAQGEIQTMDAPEILSASTISNFKLKSYVTADGKQVNYADTARYDVEVLDQYDDSNMKDLTYNVILDPYEYMIGIERNQDPDKYLFLTGIDTGASNLSKKNADVNVVYMDGTMDTITVDLTKSIIGGVTDGTHPVNYSQLNTWCTYSTNSNNIYTLKEVAVSTATPETTDSVKVAQYKQDVANYPGSGSEKIISQKYVSLNSADGTNNYVYGTDNTVYLNVSLEKVTVDDNTGGSNQRWIIDDSDVTVGVKNVNITVKDLTDSKEGYYYPAAEIYTLYNNKGDIIAAVTIGEDEGSVKNYVYVISSNVNREAYADGSDWTWTREVVIDGKKTDISENGSNLTLIGNKSADEGFMAQGKWFEVKYDGNGNVRKVTALEPDLTNGDLTDGFINLVAQVETANKNEDTVLLWDSTTVSKLTFKGGTLWTDSDATKGFAVSRDVKVVLALANKNKVQFDKVDDSYTGYTGLEKAIRDMNSTGNFGTGKVEVSAILVDGSATVIIINDKATPSGEFNPSTPSSDYTPVATIEGLKIKVKAHTDEGDSDLVGMTAYNALVEQGYTIVDMDSVAPTTGKPGYWKFTAKLGENVRFFTTELIPQMLIHVNGDVHWLSCTWSSNEYVSSYDFQGNWRSTSLDTKDKLDAAAKAGFDAPVDCSDTTETPLKYSIHDDAYFMDGLVKFTINSSEKAYPVLSQVKLSGNWYTFESSPDATDENDFVKVPSNGMISVTAALEGKAIKDNYYKVTITNGADTTVEFVEGDHQSTNATVADDGYYKNENGGFVKADSKEVTPNANTGDIYIKDGSATGKYEFVSTLPLAKTASNLTYNVKAIGDSYVKDGDKIVIQINVNGTASANTAGTVTIAGGTFEKGTVATLSDDNGVETFGTGSKAALADTTFTFTPVNGDVINATFTLTVSITTAASLSFS